MTCAPSKDSDQPGHLFVWSVFAVCFMDSYKGQVDSEDSDHTGRMPELIWVFAKCSGHFVDFGSFVFWPNSRQILPKYW